VTRYSYEERVQARPDTAWKVLLEAAENPAEYHGNAVLSSKVQQRFDNGFIRELQIQGMAVKERVFVDEKDGIVRYQLLEHPLLAEGEVMVRAVPTSVQSPVAPVVVGVSVQLTPKVQNQKMLVDLDPPTIVKREVQSLKKRAEELEH
jgi:hypothetical protein